MGPGPTVPGTSGFVLGVPVTSVDAMARPRGLLQTVVVATPAGVAWIDALTVRPSCRPYAVPIRPSAAR